MNDTPPSLDDLISRHFDEALPPAEHQRLTAALIADFDARLDFVEAARLHAGLEALAPALPPVKKRNVIRWLIGGAAAAVMIGDGGFFLNQPRGEESRITLQDMDALRDGKPEKPKPPSLTKRVVKAPAAALAAAAEPVDVQQLLERYYVNVSPHGLTVPQALVQLEEAIKLENIFNRPQLDQLRFSAFAPVDPMTAEPIVSLTQRTPLTVKSYLNSCNLFRLVVRHPGAIIDAPPPLEMIQFVSGWKPEIREFKAPADFLTIGGNKPPYAEGNAAAAVLARSFGIQLSDEESATFSPNPPTLTVLSTQGKLHHIGRQLEWYEGNNSPQQIFITTHYLRLSSASLPDGFDQESGQIMTAAEYSGFLAAVTNDRNAATIHVPSVIVRSGQWSNVEIAQKIGSSNSKTYKVGLSQDAKASLCGEVIRVEGLVKLGVLKGLKLLNGLDKLGLVTTDSPLPQYFNTEYELWLPDRSTGLFVADSPQPEGFVTLVCVTATIIDAAGQPMNPKPTNAEVGNGSTTAKPIEGMPGFVTSPWAQDQGPVDVSGIPSGAKVKCPYTGNSFLVP